VHVLQLGGEPTHPTQTKMHSPQITAHISPQVPMQGLIVFVQKGWSLQSPKTHLQPPQKSMHSLLQIGARLSKFDGIAKATVKIVKSKRRLNNFILIFFPFSQVNSKNHLTFIAYDQQHSYLK
jgi:hypothetical protein